LAALLVANYSQMLPFMKVAALLVANYPQMPLCMKSAAFLVAHYCMLSANSAITEFNKTSMLLLLPQVLLSIATKPPLHPFSQAHQHSSRLLVDFMARTLQIGST
jgi:hypothetical protein